MFEIYIYAKFHRKSATDANFHKFTQKSYP